MLGQVLYFLFQHVPRERKMMKKPTHVFIAKRIIVVGELKKGMPHFINHLKLIVNGHTETLSLALRSQQQEFLGFLEELFCLLARDIPLLAKLQYNVFIFILRYRLRVCNAQGVTMASLVIRCCSIKYPFHALISPLQLPGLVVGRACIETFQPPASRQI